LSETTQFSSSAQAKRWLQERSNNILTPIRAQAKKQRDDIDLAIQNLSDTSKQLYDNSAKEVEKRNPKTFNRARALNKLAHVFVERFKKSTPPEEISYDSMSKYLEETQKVLQVTDVDIRNWFPRISPYFIIDRRKFQAFFERARQAYSSLEDFLGRDYTKSKALEEALQLLDELEKVEEQLAALTEEKEKITNERLPLEASIAELEQKISDFQNKGPIDTLNVINAQIESLTNELKNEMRHLQKPFIKMQALATQGGGGGITPDQLGVVNQYLEKPFDAMVAERPGYPMLKEVLEKLEGLLAEDKLKLKPDKARKAEQSVDEILHKDSLAALQARIEEAAIVREKLLASTNLDETKRSLSQSQEQVDQLKARLASVETHEAVKENECKAAADKAESIKRTIENNVYSSIGARIKIA
jgi:uncharacterized coiled-coil protein SlyX